MDTTVREIGIHVVAAMDAAGYNVDTIGRYRSLIRQLALLAENQGEVYSSDLGVEFASMTTSPRTGKFSLNLHYSHCR